jgi:hypothetical protein
VAADTFRTMTGRRNRPARYLRSTKAIRLSEVIHLVRCNSQFSQEFDKRDGESEQGDDEEDGDANLMLNVQQGACKRHDHKNGDGGLKLCNQGCHARKEQPLRN